VIAEDREPARVGAVGGVGSVEEGHCVGGEQVAFAESLHAGRAIGVLDQWEDRHLQHHWHGGGVGAEQLWDDHGGIACLCLGIGVNLAHAPQVEGRSTACLADTGITPPTPEAFAETLLTALDARRTQRLTEGFAAIRAAWLERGPALDTHIALTSGIAGRFAGLAEDGSLLLSTGGRIHALASGEVA